MRNSTFIWIVLGLYAFFSIIVWRVVWESEHVCVRKHTGTCMMWIGKQMSFYPCEICDEWRSK